MADSTDELGDLRAATRPLRFATMRDRDTIGAEFRLLAAIHRACREEYGVQPSMRLVDALLDERRELTEPDGAIMG
ncbi:hypothetical protein [Mycobacterium noviomagense]|uniref:Uncharacterized protein n=1 Tax=Mycobacterium noviomagense TaxID=459858 RepID=A0A7I7P932_9MYCO|nr:hypothetical protein [Mycobacterium noviomagense]ORB18289.1 hypothetical protein BST37_02425 [Mycobacterium noviomagense]BBY05085.1 hypothetical protein MNVI_04030 [Mycobacterium noviomagense]